MEWANRGIAVDEIRAFSVQLAAEFDVQLGYYCSVDLTESGSASGGWGIYAPFTADDGFVLECPHSGTELRAASRFTRPYGALSGREQRISPRTRLPLNG